MTSEGKSTNSSSFWIPTAIIAAGFVIGGAVVVNGQLIQRQQGPVEEAPAVGGDSTEVAGEVAGEQVEQRILDVSEEKAAAVKGSSDAPVTIIEFSEYLCPYCAEYVGFDTIPSRPIDEEKAYRQIMSNYVEAGQVRYLFMDLPVHGDPAVALATACRCAGEQEKYWECHDLMFSEQAAGAFSEIEKVEDFQSSARSYGSRLNLDQTQFAACIDESGYQSVIGESAAVAAATAAKAWDVNAGSMRQYFPERDQARFGTPTFLINGRLLQGAQPFSEFQKIIEEELAR